MNQKKYLASCPDDHANFSNSIVLGKIFRLQISADLVMMGIKIGVLETAESIPGLSSIPVSIAFD